VEAIPRSGAAADVEGDRVKVLLQALAESQSTRKSIQ